MFCTNCGAPIPDGSRFCTNCGKQLAAPQDFVPLQTEEEAVAAETTEQFSQADNQQAAGTAAEMQNRFNQPADQQTVGEAAETQNQFGQVNNQPIPPKKKMKKGLLIGIIAGAVALVAIVAVLLLFVFPIGKVKIDLAKYVKVEYSGYDGGGKATATIDRDRFLEDYSGKIKYSKKYASLEAEGFFAAEELIDYYVFCSIDSYDFDLKNGDEVNCNIWADPMTTKIFNVSLKNEKKIISGGGLNVPFTVEGLEEAELFDPFEGIKFSYIGVEPYAELQIDWSGCPKETQENDYYFEVDKQYDLSNGDKVTITLDEYAMDYFLTQYGKAPSPTTYTFTVEGAPVLLTSLSQIDAANMSEFETACNTIIDTDYNGKHIDGITTSSYKLLGCILEVDKDPGAYNANTLYAVYELNNLIENSTPYTVYSVYYFEDVGISDGKLSYDAKDYDMQYHTAEITAGDWKVTDYYGFTSVAEVKDYIIDNESTVYTYESNLP
ncbi:MAG: zinc ribbon domain-containing protein [Lachnospiraceae bacterium]|nr:zinc ribbon domain-containing protein [Lachnospiraceae bacterium]